MDSIKLKGDREPIQQMLYEYAYDELYSGLNDRVLACQICGEVQYHIEREMGPLESDLFFNLMDNLSSELSGE